MSNPRAAKDRNLFLLVLAFALAAIGLVVLAVIQALLFFQSQIGGQGSNAILARGAIAFVVIVVWLSYVLGGARALWKEWHV